jgi:hypothetical protein
MIIRSSILKGVKIMTQATMEAVNITVPATTKEGLRAQASLLNIRGRGAMNKAQLADAVSAEMTRRAAQSLVDGTDDVLTVTPNTNGTTTYTPPADTRPPVKVPDYSAVAAIRPHGAVVALDDFPYVAHAPVEEEATPTHIKVEVSPFMREVYSAILAEYPTRAHKGAGFHLTRAARKTYPAAKSRRGGKRGGK